LDVLKSPFFKVGLSQQFSVVPPFSKGGLGGIRMIPLSEKTFGNRYIIEDKTMTLKKLPPVHLGEILLEEYLIPDCSQRVAQAFQPVQAQAKACGYRK